MSGFISSLTHLIIGLLGGNRCVLCNAELPEGQKVLCTACLVNLPRTFLHHIPENHLTRLISNSVAPPYLGLAWFIYDKKRPEANLIRLSKYFNRPEYLRYLARLYATELMAEYSHALAEIDVLLPIPMHARKELRRGFNQAHIVAEGISEITGIPVGDNLYVSRVKDTQTHRNVAERKSNVEGVFGIEYPHELDGLNIMLVDDVITTGATVTEAAHTIARSEARPASISVLAMALRRRE